MLKMKYPDFFSS